MVAFPGSDDPSWMIGTGEPAMLPCRLGLLPRVVDCPRRAFVHRAGIRRDVPLEVQWSGLRSLLDRRVWHGWRYADHTLSALTIT